MVTFSQRPDKHLSRGEFDEGSTGPSDPQTLDVPPTGIALKSLLGKASFHENASLMLSFQGVAQPLVIQPPSIMALGRVERHPSDIPVLDLSPYGAKDQGVSRYHAALHRSKRTLALEDMNSTNGTFVNGWRLKPREPQVLHHGDEISLGSLLIQISFQS